jgi:hypothetical protein
LGAMRLAPILNVAEAEKQWLKNKTTKSLRLPLKRGRPSAVLASFGPRCLRGASSFGLGRCLVRVFPYVKPRSSRELESKS